MRIKAKASKGIVRRCKTIGTSFLCFLLIVANVLLYIFEAHANLYLGRGDIVIEQAEDAENWDSTYYKMDYDTELELELAAATMVERISSEGFVLMKNNGALPLASNAKLTLLGRTSADPIYGGSGSGSVSLDDVVDIRDSLLSAGFDINETVYSILSKYASFTTEVSQTGSTERKYDNPRGTIVMDSLTSSSYYIGEMPVEYYTQDAVSTFSTYADAAIITIGRGGGEGGDLTQDMSGWDDNYVDGQHQLELNYDELQAIALAKSYFDTVIVIINSSSAMELGVLADDDEIDAILWVGSPGQTGFYALGDILNGTVNPSGRTVDIYPTDFTADPTFVNFGNFKYSNISVNNATGDAFYVQYEEGIYIGYRYYETAATEGFIDYDSAVVYPFGYGLSYTTFEWEIVSQALGDTDGEIIVDVRVTNTGDTYAGKDVVQMYYSPPYYTGGIEKSEVVLADFAKTETLQPGESEVLSLSLQVESMASYDYKEEKAYVLDSGDYDILIQNNSHSLKEGIAPIVYTVDDTIVYSEDKLRSTDVSTVTNQFDDVNAYFTDVAEEGRILNLSRANFEDTFPTAPIGVDRVADDTILAAFQTYNASDYINETEEANSTPINSDLNLIDMRGLEYDNPLWDIFVDQIAISDIVSVVMDAAYATKAIESIGKPATVELDGPSGLNAYMGDIQGMSYPSQVVMASTFNEELLYEFGLMLGNEALYYGVNGWYAPGVNIHRSPFAGRNFEYYSEDPLLSGMMATAVIEGAAEKGVYTFLKHFALNDQETNRVNNGVSVWANEQTIREIYLKPFELAIHNAQMTLEYHADDDGVLDEVQMGATTGIMSSFNRIGGTWAGGYAPLLENVLRDEWGFEGVVISDFNLYDYMDSNQGLSNGTDFYITFASVKSIQDTESATAINDLKLSAHRLLYTIANSNAMNGIVPGTTFTYKMATWKKVQIAVDIIAVAVIVTIVIYKKRKVKLDIPTPLAE